MRRYGRAFFIRLGVILALGAGCMVAVARLRRARRPSPAPAPVQRRGLELAADILTRVASTEFGTSLRGQLLAETIREFLRRRRVVFAAEIAPQALYRREADGYEVLYVKVLRLSGKLVHQSKPEIAEGLFHEAVHARQGRGGEASIEEECDGYAAGLCAGAAVAGRELPEVLTIDGAPVAQFVIRAYPGLSRSATYQPVGAPREWLMRRTGLQ